MNVKYQFLYRICLYVCASASVFLLSLASNSFGVIFAACVMCMYLAQTISQPNRTSFSHFKYISVYFRINSHRICFVFDSGPRIQFRYICNICSPTGFSVGRQPKTIQFQSIRILIYKYRVSSIFISIATKFMASKDSVRERSSRKNENK